ncbi:MAG: PEP-CTERM sorting domain-containing protein [Opitutus sp.]|nr:PEP-CTERM sorting domain-containing protein [Opitutus sp.]MCS6246568.1 PEP-CTERM sorting domain-containing protein [Opitutus sp.]MCS6272747.1 PEP-CTERM sorting domain-containing protein [Opitutus sp.]MCS6276379.1 PEP-CTERM sorting domain-containing protein [Opitutus sp.]MCS6301973.1 PEP-CTERM sorting domain-containing protein [Opitutus sp.]
MKNKNYTKNPVRTGLLALLALFASAPLASAQTVIYRETFQNTSGSNANLNTTGWFLYQTNSTTPATTQQYTGNMLISPNAGAGNFSALPNINNISNNTPSTSSQQTTQTADTSNNGFLFSNPTQNVGNVGTIFATNEYFSTGNNPTTGAGIASGVLTTDNISKISAVFAFGRTAVVVPTLRIGTTWFAYTVGTTPAVDGSFTALATNSPTVWDRSVFTSADWAPLSGMSAFIEGSTTSTISVGASAVLPASSAINAIGFYTTYTSASTGGLRLDNVTVETTAISAIPEPSTYAALAGLGVLILAVLRRRPAA